MLFEFDPAKRLTTLALRQLDFAEACRIFEGDLMTRHDDRFDYGEERFISIGKLRERHVVLVWTWRLQKRRIISMRYANVKEALIFDQTFAS